MPSELATAFVRVRADTTGFAKELEGGLQKGSASANRAGAKTAESFAAGLRNRLKSLMTVAAKAGTAAFVAGAAYAIDQGVKLEESQVALARAVRNAGDSWAKFTPLIDSAGKRMERFGYSSAQTDDALKTLTTATGSAKIALGLLSTAANVAAFQHTDLATAANLVAKAAGGNSRALRGLNIELASGVDPAHAMAKAQATLSANISSAGGMAKFAAGHHLTLAAAQKLVGQAAAGSIPAMNKLGIDVLPATATSAQRAGEMARILNERIGGQAAVAAGTAEGKLKLLKAEFTDMAAKLGEKLLPALGGLVGWFTRGNRAADALYTVMGLLAAVMAAKLVIGVIALAKALKLAAAGQWLLNVAMDANPIGLVIVVVMALVAAFVILWNKSAAFRNFWKAVWHDILAALAWVVGKILGYFGDIIHGAAHAFGWIPGIGGKLKAAAGWFDTFRNRVNSAIGGISGRTVHVGVAFAAAQSGHQGPSLSHLATGGAVRGAGSGTSDSNLAWLSHGEYVVKAASVSRYGTRMMDAINAQRFASGGLNVTTGGPSRAAITADLMPEIRHLARQFAKAATAAGTGGYGDTGARSGNAQLAQSFAASVLPRGWSFPALLSLWNQESGWNAYAVNPSSGAYGIPQSLGHGHPYNLGDYKAQIMWGINYIAGRYGNSQGAWAHEQAYNWYDRGGWLPPGLSLAANRTGRPERVLAPGEGTHIVLEVRSGGSRLDDALVEIIRHAVKVRGGGNVQVALGRRGA